ncbi:Vacuolar protease A [Blyttiomyces sp. JEL0837]|nr:Vacuolar protease A [Blyttiomyces sp. JEL0837]
MIFLTTMMLTASLTNAQAITLPIKERTVFKSFTHRGPTFSSLKSHHALSKRQTTGTSAPIIDRYIDTAYFVEATFGSSSKTFELAIDTNSGETFVRGDKCVILPQAPDGKDDGSCDGPKLSVSATGLQKVASNFSLTYGSQDETTGLYDVFATGDVYRGSIGLGDFRSTSNMLFGVTAGAYGLSSDFGDGVLGLSFAYSSISEPVSNAGIADDNSYFIDHLPAGTPKVIGLYLQNSNDGDMGHLTLGGYDSSKITGVIAYIPLVEGDYWNIDLTGATWEVEGSTSAPSSFAPKASEALISVLNTYTFVDESVADSINAALGGKLEPDNTYFRLDCAKYRADKYPTITLTIQFYKFKIPPSAYVVIYDDNDCYSAFARASYNLLGTSLLRSYYTILDKDNRRVGFGLAKHASAGPGTPTGNGGSSKTSVSNTPTTTSPGNKSVGVSFRNGMGVVTNVGVIFLTTMMLTASMVNAQAITLSIKERTVLKSFTHNGRTFSSLKSHPIHSKRQTTGTSTRIIDKLMDKDYFVEGTFGSSSATFELAIDTASADTFVRGENCFILPQAPDGKDDGSCDGPKLSVSGTGLEKAASNFSLTYGSQDATTGLYSTYISGDVYRGSIGLGSVKSASNMLFGVTAGEYGVHSGFGDGVLGLSYDYSSISKPVSKAGIADNNAYFMDHLPAGTPKIIGLYLQNVNDGDIGQLTLGGYDSSKITGDITYLPLVEGGYWNIDLTGTTWEVEGSTSGPSSFAPKSSNSIISVLSSYNFVDAAVADSINSALGAKLESDNHYYRHDCNKFLANKYPAITVTIQSHKFKIPPSAYIVIYEDNTCYSAFVRGTFNNGDNDYTIFGTSLLRTYYTILDKENKRVGFGLANHATIKTGGTPTSTGGSSKTSVSNTPTITNPGNKSAGVSFKNGVGFGIQIAGVFVGLLASFVSLM